MTDYESARALADDVRVIDSSSNVVSTTLKTDERVIARVTDGIYRQPGSALRELIVNAYDADATRVDIKTDAPRFERISVEDNGHGMTPDVLAHLIFHIGGSAKRNSDGRDLGITDPDNTLLSPCGRQLIGKIGIGLFSVSHLTHTFQIITKVKDDPFRTIATVVLKRYQDESGTTENDGKHKFESGKVNIWREKALDIPSHGTTVVLTGIWPQARDTLRSRDIWHFVEQAEELARESGEPSTISPPKFNIGCVDSTGDLLKKTGDSYSSVPWNSTDIPENAFKKLVQAVWDEIGQSSPNPQLDKIFDFYLHMIWKLSLSIPLPYVDGHLFDMSPDDWVQIFELSNERKGQAQELNLDSSRPIREQMGLSGTDSELDKFDVVFDGIKLYRPIKYKGLPIMGGALTKPLAFIGKCREEFSGVPVEFSGGTLDFEAYLFWTPKVAPSEHRGSLIRIHGASGTLFDASFMLYQVAEQTRLRQISCEIYVKEGLDSALNIDRESFNSAHPHSVFITKWLHNALRQLSTAHKRLGREVRDSIRDDNDSLAQSNIQKLAADVWVREMDDVASVPPTIEIVSEREEKQEKEIKDAYVFNRTEIISERSSARTAAQHSRGAILEEKLKAITQVLASYELLDNLPKNKQESLLRAIYKILDANEG